MKLMKNFIRWFPTLLVAFLIVLWVISLVRGEQARREGRWFGQIRHGGTWQARREGTRLARQDLAAQSGRGGTLRSW